jgi:hypothetical protein
MGQPWVNQSPLSADPIAPPALLQRHFAAHVRRLPGEFAPPASWKKFSNPGSLSPQKGLLVKEFPMFQHFWMVIWLIHFPFSNIFGWS